MRDVIDNNKLIAQQIITIASRIPLVAHISRVNLCDNSRQNITNLFIVSLSWPLSFYLALAECKRVCLENDLTNKCVHRIHIRDDV